jgi:hypothetical protein
MKKIFILSVVILLSTSFSGCLENTEFNTPIVKINELFLHPERYEGKTIIICGRIISVGQTQIRNVSTGEFVKVYNIDEDGTLGSGEIQVYPWYGTELSGVKQYGVYCFTGIFNGYSFKAKNVEVSD